MLEFHLQVAVFFARTVPSVSINGWRHLRDRPFLKGGGPFL